MSTLNGTYEISGTDVFHEDDGIREQIYSAAYLTKGSNLWAQDHSLGYPPCNSADLTQEPTTVFYDGRSGNVVLGMGDMGVVVGLPDGKWVEVGVGPYTPIDFSFTRKLGMMFEPGRWVQNFGAALLIGLASVALVTCIPNRRVGKVYCAVVLLLSLLIVPILEPLAIRGFLFWAVGLLALIALLVTSPPREHLILGAAYSVAIYLALACAGVVWVAGAAYFRPMSGLLFMLLPLPVIAALAFHVRRHSDHHDSEIYGLRT